jgi:maltose alpha-D-glucosyltransferase/alpha-amylase
MDDTLSLPSPHPPPPPMQWTPDRNGGFSRADPARLYAPMIMDPVYGFEAVNVEAQSRSLSSLLSGTKRLISVRKSTLAFGRGSMTFIRPANRSVLAYVREYKGEVILCVANMSRSAQATELDLTAWKDRVPLEMLGRTRFPAIGELPYMITLGPYGFYWFQLLERDKSEPTAPTAVPEFETLVVPLGSTWVSLARARGVFERDVLPGHLARTRWYPENSPAAIRPTLVSAIPFCDIGDNRPWLAFFEATQRGITARYSLPMQIEWVRFDRERYNPHAFAAVRQGAREGTLLDVATAPIFIGLLLRNLSESLTVEESGLRLEFRPTAKFSNRPVREPEHVSAIDTERSNSSAVVDNDYAVKFFRKLEAGINPEIEVGRFLTEVAPFANAPALLGSVELVEADKRFAIMTVHGFVANQGDGWAVSSAYLDRFVDEQRLLAANGQAGESEQQVVPYLRYMSQAGRRAAELHLALAARSDLVDFAPEPIRPSDVHRWVDDVTARAERVLYALGLRRDATRESDRPLIDRLLMQRADLLERLGTRLPQEIDGLKIRLHGDFRLRHLLIVKDDIFITGFEGDRYQPLAERRRKAPAARDVASLIRSIDYSVTAALERALKAASEEQGRLAAALAGWRHRATTAFMTGYREIMKASRLWPADRHASDAMLDFFLLEKALCEIEDELAHHPDWLRIPLAGMLRILSEPASEI